MDDKYNVPKRKRSRRNAEGPESKQEAIQQQIEELVKRRDAGSTNLAEKQKINAEITRLFAEWQRLKL